jgi:hypothetical protein
VKEQEKYIQLSLRKCRDSVGRVAALVTHIWSAEHASMMKQKLSGVTSLRQTGTHGLGELLPVLVVVSLVAVQIEPTEEGWVAEGEMLVVGMLKAGAIMLWRLLMAMR